MVDEPTTIKILQEGYRSLSDLMPMRLVCRRWNALATSEDVWGRYRDEIVSMFDRAGKVKFHQGILERVCGNPDEEVMDRPLRTAAIYLVQRIYDKARFKRTQRDQLRIIDKKHGRLPQYSVVKELMTIRAICKMPFWKMDKREWSMRGPTQCYGTVSTPLSSSKRLPRKRDALDREDSETTPTRRQQRQPQQQQHVHKKMKYTFV